MKKIVLITGANSGIGKTAALKFAKEGYRVIMACRNIQKSEPVCSEIRQKSKNEDVELLQLDISSKQSIYSFCETYHKKYDTLDILINIAGHFKHGEKSFQRNTDGLEMTFSTNLLGPVLLTSLLVYALAKSKTPRVLNACSTNIKHFFDERRRIDFDTLRGQSAAGKSYDSYKLYGDSKIGLLMATFAMAEEYKSRGICDHAIMIPATKTSQTTFRKVKSYWRLLSILQNPFIAKAETVGNAYFSICTSELYSGVTGKLINHQGQIVQAADETLPFIKIITSSAYYLPYAHDHQTSADVWQICSRYASEA